MEKIKKGLEEKLNLITKIKNNLKIKKYDIKKLSQKQPLQFPIIDKNSPHEKQNLSHHQPQIRNPQNQITAWINIKKLGKDPEQLNFLTPNLSSRKSSTSFDDKILLTNTYTSRFASKNSLMKLVQFKSIAKDKSKSNLSVQMLRKTFLEKTSRTFSPQKLEKKLMDKRSPEKHLNFYGKINEINHVSGIRFKTLDPRFGGLTREQLKEKIKNRENIPGISVENNFSTIPLSPRASQSLKLYELEASLQQRQHRSSIHGYNFSPYEHRRGERRSRKSRGPTVKDRYSPWNQNSSEQVLWDELPKIK